MAGPCCSASKRGCDAHRAVDEKVCGIGVHVVLVDWETERRKLVKVLAFEIENAPGRDEEPGLGGQP